MALRFRILPADDAGFVDPQGATGPIVAREVEVSEASGTIRLGRAAEVELPLPFAVLSSVHARLTRSTEGGWLVEDLGSTNGTWLDGRRLARGERAPFVPGTELRLATVRLVLLAPGATAPGAEGTGTIARRLVDDLFGGAAAATPTLRVTGGAPPRALPLAVADHPYVAGRAETCALRFAADEVSREHAAFVRGAEGVVVRNLGAKNGVVVNGARISGEHPLADGDVVEIGPITLTLDDPAARYLRELEELPEAAATVAPPPDEAPRAPPAVEAPPIDAPPELPVPLIEPERPRASASLRLINAIAVSILALVILAAAALFWPRR